MVLCPPWEGFLIHGHLVPRHGFSLFFLSPNSLSLWFHLPHVTSFDSSAVGNGGLVRCIRGQNIGPLSPTA